MNTIITHKFSTVFCTVTFHSKYTWALTSLFFFWWQLRHDRHHYAVCGIQVLKSSLYMVTLTSKCTTALTFEFFFLCRHTTTCAGTLTATSTAKRSFFTSTTVTKSAPCACRSSGTDFLFCF
jgi:hypothetical protein